MAIRACVEGQFLNMKLQSAWMNLETQVVYITGGASINSAIAQVIANVFGATVQRLAVFSACALGGALRGASIAYGESLHKLQTLFCEPDTSSTIQPQDATDCYMGTMERFKNELVFALNMDSIISHGFCATHEK